MTLPNDPSIRRRPSTHRAALAANLRLCDFHHRVGPPAASSPPRPRGRGAHQGKHASRLEQEQMHSDACRNACAHACQPHA
eukprot:scaffold23234_cov28-Tisochrysis_lutea.AAC.3